MNSTKETELVRRRNVELTKELEEAKDKYDQLKYLNSASADKAKALIVELETIKDDWLATIEDLHEKQAECDKLLAVLREMKSIMEEPMPKEDTSWLRRIMDKIKAI